jgi:hypothetical protein
MLNAILYIMFGILGYFILVYPVTKKRIFFLILLGKLSFVLAAINLFQDKLATNQIDKIGEGGDSTFSLYYWVGRPMNIIGLDYRYCFALISIFLVLFLSIYLAKKFTSYQTFPLLLLNFFPDVVYFSAFTLRDVGIGVFSAYFIVELFFSKGKGRLIIPAIFLFMLRMEVAIWMAICYFLYSLKNIPRSLRFPFFVFIMVGVFFSLDATLKGVIDYIGWDSGARNSGETLLRFFMDARYERQFKDSDGSGGVSPVLPPDLYYSFSLYEVMIFQFFSFIFLSLEPHNRLMILGVSTGIIAFYFLGRTKRRLSKINLGSLFWCIILAYAIYSPFLVNGGNAFRLRLIPIICLLSIYVYVESIRKNYKISNQSKTEGMLERIKVLPLHPRKIESK